MMDKLHVVCTLKAWTVQFYGFVLYHYHNFSMLATTIIMIIEIFQ